jgi:hypothetical protein
MKKELYSEIENLIINWNNDGTKTAGSLTREIMIVLSSLIDKTNEENNKKEKYFQQFHPPVNRRY